MQVQVKDIEEKKDKVFHPFVLEFKIESEENLLELIAKFNMSCHAVIEELKELGYPYMDRIPHDGKVWDYLNQLYVNKPYMK